MLCDNLLEEARLSFKELSILYFLQVLMIADVVFCYVTFVHFWRCVGMILKMLAFMHNFFLLLVGLH